MREIRQSGLTRGMVTAKAVAISTLLHGFVLWLISEVEPTRNAAEPYLFFFFFPPVGSSTVTVEKCGP